MRRGWGACRLQSPAMCHTPGAHSLLGLVFMSFRHHEALNTAWTGCSAKGAGGWVVDGRGKDASGSRGGVAAVTCHVAIHLVTRSGLACCDVSAKSFGPNGMSATHSLGRVLVWCRGWVQGGGAWVEGNGQRWEGVQGPVVCSHPPCALHLVLTSCLGCGRELA
jgi:hypothetical protein